MCNVEENQTKYSFFSTSSTVKTEDVSCNHPTENLNRPHEPKEVPNSGTVNASVNKNSLDVQQCYRNENTEAYINCVRNMSRFNERWQYSNKQPKVFYFYERNYKEKETTYRKSNYDRSLE